MEPNSKDGKKGSVTVTNTEPSKKSLGCALSVITLNSSETFQCETKDLYEVLTNEAMVSAFTSGKCVVEACKGGKYVNKT